MISGCVTEIQRYSTHEGPGIRTTVFLKGCQMNCQWCHNPETINNYKELMYYSERCIGCRLCLEACAYNVHTFHENVHKVNFTNCVACGACIEECWNGALVMSGKTMTTEVVFMEIIEDLPFYGNEGGVTFSGGEPLLQMEFLIELLHACKNANIGTAIESNLLHSKKIIKRVLPLADMILCDIKTMDDSKHKQYTGASNTTIIENVNMIDSEGIPLIIRTPLVNGINDSHQDAENIGKFLSSLKNLNYYEVLPYHSLGLLKSRAMGKKEILFDTPKDDAVDTYLEIIRSYGITAYIGGEQ